MAGFGMQKHSSLPLPKAAESLFLSSFSEPATPAKIEGSLAARDRAQQPESYSTSLMYVAASPPCQSYVNISPQRLSAFSMPMRHILLRVSGFSHAEVSWSRERPEAMHLCIGSICDAQEILPCS